MFPTESLNQAKSGGGGNRTREPFPTELAAQRKTAGWVYLITDGMSYKIGFARDPEKRLKLLQTGHPEELRIVGVMEGSRTTERELHELFAGSHWRGEWFGRDKEILWCFDERGFLCTCRRTVDAECFIHGEGPAW